MKRIGFIDFYLDEWHANNYPRWIHEATNGEMEVAFAYGQIDSPLPGRRTTEDWCREMRIERCKSIEELIEKSDCLVVLSPDNAEMHESLCQLPLRSGKPTYVDKTFAPDADTAERIFAVAEASGTPCYTTSSLRFADSYQAMVGKPIDAIASWGPGNLDTYSIHQLEPLMMMMGAEAARVLYTPGKDWYNLLIEFTDGRKATVTGFAGGSPFSMNLATPGGNKVLSVDAEPFWDHFTKVLVEFFRTGKEPVSHQETMAIMRVRSAAVEASRRPGEWVCVR